MRRLVVLALAVAVCALPPAVGSAGSAPVGSAVAAKKCSKKKRHHRKRKHRRCGRNGAGGGNGSGQGDQQGAQADTCPNTPSSPGRVGAHESEYQIVLTRASVSCRTVIVEQDNLGEDPHDLVLQKVGNASPSYAFGELGPGGVATQTLDLGRGTWTLYCSLPGHYDLGMHVNLQVD
jgi:hypothetical protein